MCGIAGAIFADAELLDQFCTRLAHRGPDDRGVWRDRDFGLAHTRLAIIDLSPGGHQPMESRCGRWVISYNGEIYNYRELRRDLESGGVKFRSTSDTEVLLELLTRRGTAALSLASGMFSIALWDRERQELLLARDRVGIKPLVYAPLPSGGIAFASEIQAVLAHPGVSRELDPEAISEYLACLYVPAPRTVYRAVRKLPPGHYLRWQRDRLSVERYWRPQFRGNRTISVDEAVDELLPILRRSVARHTIADVQVGCFLSGGIDSSVVAALMAEQNRSAPIRTFTLTFDQAAYDERDGAREVAAYIGSQHTELPATPTRISERLGPMLQAFGEPFGNPTALLIDELSRKAREHVTVALVGDGGDEVFAGYPRYQGGLLAREYRRLPSWLREGVLEPASRLIPEGVSGRHTARRLREFLAGANLADAEMYASWAEYFSPQERAAVLGQTAVPERPVARLYRAADAPTPLDAMQQTDFESFLPGNILAYGDAMSMMHALELRLPLLDHCIIERVAQFSPELRCAQGLKTLLRAVARRLLPDSVLRRPKRGLNPPLGQWLANDLRSLVDERLTSARLRNLGLNPGPVLSLIDEHRRGRRDHSLKIWSLIVLDAWFAA